MATASQILANRENAMHSTGPRTEEGKARSSQNAVRHGLASKTVVLPNESQEEYDEFRESLLLDLRPVTEREQLLAAVVAETFWRRQRFYRLENAFLSSRQKALSEANPELSDGDEALVMLFTDPAEMAKSRLMLRYVTAAERAYRSAVAELEKAQKERREHENEQNRVSASVQDPHSGKENGFVSNSAGDDAKMAARNQRLASMISALHAPLPGSQSPNRT